jgi:hypothetical protein
MMAPGLKKEGVDGRVKHGHDVVGGWVIRDDAWYKEAVSEVALVSRIVVIFEHRSGAAYWP